MILVDTHAWIEYFIGSPAGRRARRLIEDPSTPLVTPECCLAEIRGWALRESRDFRPLENLVRQNSKVEPVRLQDWMSAADIRHEMRTRRRVPTFGMMDALLVAQQRRMGCRLLTGDPHFKGLRGVVYVGD